MWLPPVDPAGSPRVGHKPSPRTARVENPYIPPKFKGRPGIPGGGANTAPAGADDGGGGGYSHDDAAVPSVNSKVRMPLSARAPTTSLEGHSRSPRSASASASVGASPRGSSVAMTEAAMQSANRKRLERLEDSYRTAFSREQLLSEQYDKELVQVRERLQQLREQAPADLAKAALSKAEKTKVKLERRVSGFESKLNELDTYNFKLVSMIDALRRQNEPHRTSTKRVLEQLDKLALDMTTQKAACHKALDERERIIDQIKHLQDDSHRDALDFEAQVESLKRDSEELDHANANKEAVIDRATELEKRKMCASMRTSRAQKEKLEVRYGYLRSQLEGIDNDFRELQRIVGVHFQPSHPESLQQIIDTFVEKEQRVASLQKYLTLQSDEVETLSHQVTALERQAEAVEAVGAAEAAEAAAAHASNSKKHAADEDGSLDKLSAEFDSLCEGLGRMFQHAGCSSDPSGAHLATKGCSSSTINDFLSAIASRIDDMGRKAYTLREVGLQAQSRSGRKPTPAVEPIRAFLTPRGSAAAAAPPEAAPSGSDDGGSVAGGTAAAAGGGAAAAGTAPVVLSKEALVAKENLPSISDIGPEADGEAEASEGRRRKGTELKKGAIDREKRDAVIASWVARQQMVRGAQSARPNVREYYDDDPDPKWPQRAVYPPASAR